MDVRGTPSAPAKRISAENEMRHTERCASEAVEKLSFSEQPLARNHAFERISKKNRVLRTHFFFPCINSEIHASGIYEFAKQIRLNACCRTKHKNKILLFRQASHPAFAGWFFVVKCVGGNWRNVTFIFHKKDTSAMQRCLFIHLEMNGFLERIAGFEN